MALNYFEDPELIRKPPVQRAAYSDRTAYIMAELSRLVYETLPPEASVANLFAEIKEAVSSGESDNEIKALIQRAVTQMNASDSAIETILEDADFELLECFVNDGTEAVLVRLKANGGFPGMLVVAFRGTEPNVKDILTDVKADLVSAEGGGRLHRGFINAFEKVRQPIETALTAHAGVPVYFTGHSLGGALAIIATRYLCADSNGATYTFGSPRVGDERFFASVKTPVYRIVNAADAVPRLPFGMWFAFLLGVIRYIPLNGTFAVAEWLRKRFSGYTHYGDLIFLSNHPNESGSDGIAFQGLAVKRSPSFFYRVHTVVISLSRSSLKAAVNDHRINEYTSKLLAYAQRRNR